MRKQNESFLINIRIKHKKKIHIIKLYTQLKQVILNLRGTILLEELLTKVVRKISTTTFDPLFFFVEV